MVPVKPGLDPASERTSKWALTPLAALQASVNLLLGSPARFRVRESIRWPSGTPQPLRPPLGSTMMLATLTSHLEPLQPAAWVDPEQF